MKQKHEGAEIVELGSAYDLILNGTKPTACDNTRDDGGYSIEQED